VVDAWLISAGLGTVAALAAAVGARRIRSLNAPIREPRLERLVWFFVLAGAAAAVKVAELALLQAQDGIPGRDGFDAFDVLFWLHHALLVAAVFLGAAATGMPHRAPAAAMAPLLLAAEPVLRMVEALGFLFLVLVTVVNHVRRASVGSLQVAVGFFLLFAAHGLFLYNGGAGAQPLGPRDPWGEAAAAVGLILLATKPFGGRTASA
jgi:hypothetical protein